MIGATSVALSKRNMWPASGTMHSVDSGINRCSMRLFTLGTSGSSLPARMSVGLLMRRPDGIVDVVAIAKIWLAYPRIDGGRV